MIIGWILIALALTELLIGLRFIFGYQKNQTTLWYGLFMIGVAVYVGSNGFGYLNPSHSATFAEHLGWAGGILATVLFLPFSYSFPVIRKSNSEMWALVMWPILIFVPAVMGTDLIIKHQAIMQLTHGYTSQPGPYLWAYIAVFCGYWLWSIINMVVGIQHSDGINRRHVSLLLVGVLVSLGIAIYTDMYMTLTSVMNIGYLGSLATSIWFGFTSYILLKK
jgi:hypothetical protein